MSPTPSDCTPPAVNLAAPLASLAAGEPGACKSRNADSWAAIGSFLDEPEGMAEAVERARVNRLHRAARARRNRYSDQV